MKATSSSSFSTIACAALSAFALAAEAKEISSEAPTLQLTWPGAPSPLPSSCEVLHLHDAGRHAIVSERGGVVRLHGDPACRDVSVVVSNTATDACVVRGALPGSDVAFLADGDGVLAFVPDASAAQGYVTAKVPVLDGAGIVRLVGGSLGLDGAAALFAVDASSMVHVVALVPTPGAPLGLDTLRTHHFPAVDADGKSMQVDDIASIDWDGDPANETQIVLHRKGRLVVCSAAGAVLLQRDAGTAGSAFTVVRQKGGFDALAWTGIDGLGRPVLRVESAFGADVDVLLGTKPVRALLSGDSDGDGDGDLVMVHSDAATVHVVTNAARSAAVPSNAFAHYDAAIAATHESIVFEATTPDFTVPAFAPIFDDWAANGAPVHDLAMPVESADAIVLHARAKNAAAVMALDASHPVFGASTFFASSVAEPTPPPPDWSSSGHFDLTLRDAWPTLPNKNHVQVMLWRRDPTGPYADPIAVSDTFHAIGPATFDLDVRVELPEVATESGGTWNGYFDDLYYVEVRAVQATGSPQDGYTIHAAGRSYIVGVALDDTLCDPTTAPVTSLEALLADPDAGEALASFCYAFSCGASVCNGSTFMVVPMSTNAVPVVRIPFSAQQLPRLPAGKKMREVNPPKPCSGT